MFMQVQKQNLLEICHFNFLIQEVSQLRPMGQITSLADFCKFLQEHSCVHLFVSCLWLPSGYNSSETVATKTKWPVEPKTFSLWPFTENVCWPRSYLKACCSVERGYRVKVKLQMIL